MKITFTTLFTAKNLALSLFFTLPMLATAQTVLFFQDFSGATIGSHVGSGGNLLDFIGTNTPNTSTPPSSVYLSTNKLALQRNGANVAFVKSTDFTTTPTTLKVKFKFNVSFGSAMASGTAAVLYVGGGFNANTTTTGEVRHSSLGFVFSAGSTFNLRNLNDFTLSATAYSGQQEVTWYVNNGGSTITYPDPSGGTSSLDDDKADVWVGTTRVFTAIPAVAPTQDITDFKFLFNNANGNSAFAIDDIEVSTGFAGTIPITLSSFAAKKAGETNQLTWTTETEINNKGYDVQRQTSNGAWETLGFVNGAGKASTYTFEDKAPLSVNYYRLRQIDFDGKETLSKVVSVSQDGKGRIRITPNPTSDKVNINLTQNNVTNQEATLILYDMTGRQVLMQRATGEAMQLDLSNVAKGMYMLTVQSNNAVYQEKIIRQ
jgi:Secretion system C-terminal sorting domain